MLVARNTTGETSLKGIGQFNRVASAFDGIADIFDTTLENEITARLRSKLYSAIESLVSPGSIVLDINCGTGIDACFLAGRGYRMFGVDISEKMIATAQMKQRSAECKNVEFRVSSYDSLSPGVVPEAELTFSNFGGLNCTSDLTAAANAIASVTRPGGYFVGVIMPPFSLWEFLSYAARFQLRESLRRMHNSSPATGFHGSTFPVYYYSTKETVSAFAPHFEHIQTIGLSILSPTPQSIQFTRRHPVLTKSLIGIDSLIERLPILRSIGDHYLIVLRRRQ